MVNKKKEGVERVIKDFIFSEANSLVVPYTKKFKNDVQYRLSSVLHEKFLAEKNVDISYSQFTRHVCA